MNTSSPMPINTQTLVSANMAKLCPADSEVQWVSKDIPGGYFMAPSAGQFRVKACGSEQDLSAEATGALVCLFTYEQLGTKTLASRFITLRDNLLAYIKTMPEAGNILACAGIK